MTRETYIYRTNEYVLEYEIVENNPREKGGVISITGCKGRMIVVNIPSYIETVNGVKPVKYIGKKAFLGNNHIRKIEIPGTIAMIDDFAFAQCGKLNTIVISRENREENVTFGRKVFEECTALMNICVNGDNKDTLSVLLAAIPVRLYDEHLLSDSNIGSPDWFKKWDNKLVTFILEDDEEGYTDLALCGEEDIKSDIPMFMSNKRMQKSALCLLRLKYSDMLSEEHKEMFEGYIMNHVKGCKSDEAWKVILRDFADDIDYYKLLASLGGINADGIDEMIADIGEKHAEAKAYLMNYKNENFVSDIFDMFSL